MTEYLNRRPWDTETASHKISHDEYYEKWGTTDKTKHKPSMLQPRIGHTLSSRHALLILARYTAEATCRLGMECWCKTRRTAALSLVYSIAEYCAAVWCCSTHTCLIDSVLNDALVIVTGCLRPTPTDHLPILSGIPPAELCRLGATLSLAYLGSLDPDHILYGLLSGSSDARQVRLRSRRPFVPVARNFLDNLGGLGIRASEWKNHK